MVRELLAVAARAALQWALATLLLVNGAAFCLIAAVSERLRLGSPCILCARVHRLLCSTAQAGNEGRKDALRLLLCDAHLAATVAATTGPPGQHARRAPPDRDKVPGALRGDGRVESRCGLCWHLATSYIVKSFKSSNSVSSLHQHGLETHRVVSIGSEICEKNHDDTNGSDDDDEARSGGGADNSGNDNNSPLVSLFELAPMMVAHRQDDEGEEQSSSLHKATPQELCNVVEAGERLTVGQLLSLRAQRRELDALRAELYAERRAREATEERRRQAEEQGTLDREAARLAVELVHETERQKHALQQQLDDACRAKLYDGGDAQHGVEEGGGDGDNNNYQSLVDFLPWSAAYASSPDLVNLLKIYTTERAAGNGGIDRRRHRESPAVTAVAEEVEEEGTAVVHDTVEEESSVRADASSATISPRVSTVRGHDDDEQRKAEQLLPRR